MEDYDSGTTPEEVALMTDYFVSGKKGTLPFFVWRNKSKSNYDAISRLLAGEQVELRAGIQNDLSNNGYTAVKFKHVELNFIGISNNASL